MRFVSVCYKLAYGTYALLSPSHCWCNWSHPQFGTVHYISSDHFLEGRGGKKINSPCARYATGRKGLFCLQTNINLSLTISKLGNSSFPLLYTPLYRLRDSRIFCLSKTTQAAPSRDKETKCSMFYFVKCIIWCNLCVVRALMVNSRVRES